MPLPSLGRAVSEVRVSALESSGWPPSVGAANFRGMTKTFLTTLAVALAAAALAASSASAAHAPVPDFTGFLHLVTCNEDDSRAWVGGTFNLYTGQIRLRPAICKIIKRAVTGHLRNQADVIFAATSLVALGHEFSHALGTLDRNITATGENADEPDCVGWLLLPWVGWHLHISAKTMQRLEGSVTGEGRKCLRVGITVPVVPY